MKKILGVICIVGSLLFLFVFATTISNAGTAVQWIFTIIFFGGLALGAWLLDLT